MWPLFIKRFDNCMVNMKPYVCVCMCVCVCVCVWREREREHNLTDTNYFWYNKYYDQLSLLNFYNNYIIIKFEASLYYFVQLCNIFAGKL